MALASTDTAILTARFGVARFGASRFGFCPKDTMGSAPGILGPFYQWWQTTRRALSTWTLGRH